jgi:hypothetical protein
MLLDGSSARNMFNAITIGAVMTSGFEIAKAQRGRSGASDARPKLLILAGDVAFGSKADLTQRQCDVRFAPEGGNPFTPLQNGLAPQECSFSVL